MDFRLDYATTIIGASAAEVGDTIRVLVTSTDDSGYTTVFASAGKVIAEDNAAAVFTSAATATVAENDAAWSFNFSANDVDGDNSQIKFALVTNPSSKFALTEDGKLTLTSAFDYETMGTNKFVDVKVSATDDRGAVTEQTIKVTVTDVPEQVVHSFSVGGVANPETKTITNWTAGDKIVIDVNGDPSVVFAEWPNLFTGGQRENTAKATAALNLGVDFPGDDNDNVSVAYFSQNANGGNINAMVAVDGNGDGTVDLYIKIENVGVVGALDASHFDLI